MSTPAAEASPEPDEPEPGHPAAVIPMRARRAQSGPISASASPPQRGAWQTDGALALRTPPPSPHRPAAAAGARLVDAAADVPDAAARAAVLVARGLLEVLSGWRSPGQLARWTSASLQYDLERRAPRRPTGQRQQLLRVRIAQQAPGVSEACALTRDLVRDRVRVMALRLELRGEQWIVTRLSAG